MSLQELKSASANLGRHTLGHALHQCTAQLSAGGSKRPMDLLIACTAYCLLWVSVDSVTECQGVFFARPQVPKIIECLEGILWPEEARR